MEEQREYTNSLIWTVKQTIWSMRGECEMSDKEKFEAFKQRMVKDNEEVEGCANLLEQAVRCWVDKCWYKFFSKR